MFTYNSGLVLEDDAYVLNQNIIIFNYKIIC